MTEASGTDSDNYKRGLQICIDRGCMQQGVANSAIQVTVGEYQERPSARQTTFSYSVSDTSYQL